MVLNEIIVLSINNTNKTAIDSIGQSIDLKKDFAYLVKNFDGTHERWVVDKNLNISKQTRGNFYEDQIEILHDRDMVLNDLLEQVESDTLGVIYLDSSVLPTEPGKYLLGDLGNYVNLVPVYNSRNIIAEEGYINYTFFDGTIWHLIKGKTNIKDKNYNEITNSNTTLAIYQADKLINLKLDLSSEFNKYEVKFSVLGWNEINKTFNIELKLISIFNDIIPINLTTSQINNIVYTSIPLVNIGYVFDLYATVNNDTKLAGKLSFTYDWQKIAGDTSFHLFTSSTLDTNYIGIIPEYNFSYKDSLKTNGILVFTNYFTFTYQVDKIDYININLISKYEGSTIYINQIGWLESQKKFFFDIKIKDKNGAFKSVKTENIFPISYDSIPLQDILYSIELFDDKFDVIGTLDLKYLWSKINGDTTNYLVNSGNYELDNIKVVPNITSNILNIKDFSIYKISRTESNSNAVYQYDKLLDLTTSVLPEYKYSLIYIKQLGWLESQKTFFINFVLKLEDNTLIEFPSNILYGNIPNENKYYNIPLINNNIVIGEVSFTYDWESINGDLTVHILNSVNILNDNILLKPTYTYSVNKEDYTKDVLNVKKPKEYGFNFSYQGGSFPNTSVVSIKDEILTNSGWLKKITFQPSVIGVFTIGIGKIDQRNWYLERTRFNVETNTTGIQDFDVSSQNIIMEEDEQVFIYVKFNGNENIWWATYNTTFEKEMIYGGVGAGSTIEPLPTEFGGGTYLLWDIQEIDTILATKQELKSIEDIANNALSNSNTALSNLFKIKDRNGNFYKMLYDNGNISLIPMQFEKVLVIGNSVTTHAILNSFGGWLSSVRGMASSTPNVDFCKILEDSLKVKIPTASVTRFGGALWEQDLQASTAFFDTFFTSVLSQEFDLIVFRLSENLQNTSPENLETFKNGIVAMIRYLWTKYPLAEVILTSDVMDASAIKSAPIIDAANILGVTYVDASALSWQYKVMSNGQYVPFYYKGDDNINRPIQKMFHSHPYDYGMLKVANAILGGINYPLSTIDHDVIITTTKDIDAPFKGIKGGLYTILGYDSIPLSATIKDSNNNNISYTINNMSSVVYYTNPERIPTWSIVFEMPNTNVTVIV